MARMPEAAQTATKRGCPAWIAPMAKFHLLIKPTTKGVPAMPKEAMAKQPTVADTIHLTDVVEVGADDNAAGTHEEGDLHDSMGHQVQIRALKGQRREERAT